MQTFNSSLVFFYLDFILPTLTIHRAAEKGRGPSLYLSTVFTCSKTFRHSFAVLHPGWLSSIFNCGTCKYQSSQNLNLNDYCWILLYETLCANWHHLYNLKNDKNTHRGVLLLVQLQAQLAALLKVTLPYGCFYVGVFKQLTKWAVHPGPTHICVKNSGKFV